jgi:hypothetical protein
VVLPWITVDQGMDSGAILAFVGAEQFAAGLLN